MSNAALNRMYKKYGIYSSPANQPPNVGVKDTKQAAHQAAIYADKNTATIEGFTRENIDPGAMSAATSTEQIGFFGDNIDPVVHTVHAAKYGDGGNNNYTSHIGVSSGREKPIKSPTPYSEAEPRKTGVNVRKMARPTNYSQLLSSAETKANTRIRNRSNPEQGFKIGTQRVGPPLTLTRFPPCQLPIAPLNQTLLSKDTLMMQIEHERRFTVESKSCQVDEF